jgi:hypothetical protein
MLSAGRLESLKARKLENFKAWKLGGLKQLSTFKLYGLLAFQPHKFCLLTMNYELSAMSLFS